MCYISLYYVLQGTIDRHSFSKNADDNEVSVKNGGQGGSTADLIHGEEGRTAALNTW